MELTDFIPLLPIGFIYYNLRTKAIEANLATERLIGRDADLEKLINSCRGQQTVYLNGKTLKLNRISRKGRILVTIEETTELARARLRVSCLEQILDSIGEGVHWIDTQGVTEFYNNAISEMEGIPGEKILNRPITDVYQITSENSVQLRVVREKKAIKDLFTTYFRMGKKIDVMASHYPIVRNGEILGSTRSAGM